MTGTIFIIQVLNSLFYAAVLFLIAAGLSLIYGVMRIVNLAHGTLYALGAYVAAWIVGGAFGHAVSRHARSRRPAPAAAARRGRHRRGRSGDRADAAAPALPPAGGVSPAADLRPADDLRRHDEAPVRRHAAVGGQRSWITWAAFRSAACSIRPTISSSSSSGLLAAVGLWWFIYRTRFPPVMPSASQIARIQPFGGARSRSTGFKPASRSSRRSRALFRASVFIL